MSKPSGGAILFSYLLVSMLPLPAGGVQQIPRIVNSVPAISALTAVRAPGVSFSVSAVVTPSPLSFTVPLAAAPMTTPNMAPFAAAAGVPVEAASTPQEPAGYRQIDIVKARFGDTEQQGWVKRARTFKPLADRMIIGEGRATQVIQDKLVQYAEGYGTRTKEPIAAHLIGLSGIGKTAMLQAIEQAGFTVEKIDSQKFAKADNGDYAYANELQKIVGRNAGKPYVLLVDELDKLPEIVDGKEETIPFVGALNQILSDGSFDATYQGRLDFSNTLILTTMNFGPKEIENFSTDALKIPKKYLDFSVEDFAMFDQWVQKEPAAPYKLLSQLFRSNTVNRLATNTVIMNSLSHENYRAIVRLNIDAVIAQATLGNNVAKRVVVSYTKAYEDFLYKNAVFAPSGARETVVKVGALTQQLIDFSVKASVKGDRSLAQPRKVLMEFNPETGNAEVSITPQVLRRGKLAERPPFKINLAYDPVSKRFIEPANVALTPPPLPAYKEKRVTKKQILAARFYDASNKASGLAEKIDASLIGQEAQTQLIEKELNSYLNRPRPVVNQPPFLVFAGFPGIGKSELANLAAKNLGLPLVRVNMQKYSSDSAEAVTNFGQELAEDLAEAKKKAPNGKFVLLFEELDKVFEINQKGEVVNRPIMAIIKDLLQDGVVAIPNTTSSFGRAQPSNRIIDVRDAYNIVTMNFRGDLFDFKADPRLTTIEDTRRAAEELAMSPAALRETLDTMFLPETISRLIPRFHIMSPLDEPAYKKLIRVQADAVVTSRFVDTETQKNYSRLTVKMTPAYRRYLFGETVIPSEGARNTVVASQNRIANHVEDAIALIPRSSPLAAKPAALVLDFKPGSSEVVAFLLPETKGKAPKRLTLYRKKVALTFPPLAARGRMKEERIKIAAHEFGHAFTAVRLGLRIEHVIAVPPSPGIGGFVSYPNGQEQTARTMIAHIYSGLGSRAMERIIMSRRPANPLSVLDITPGPSGDIKGVTKELWKVFHQLGFDPMGGTIERSGRTQPEASWQYAEFSALPPDEVNRLGRVARKMEDQLVDDLLKAHDLTWYQDKIRRFAKAGGLTEREFYALIEFPYPGRNDAYLGENSRIAELFGADSVKQPREVAKAKAFKQGRTKTTAAQNMDTYLEQFASIVKEELHPDVREHALARQSH